MKKLLSFVLVITIVLSVSVSAFAKSELGSLNFDGKETVADLQEYITSLENILRTVDTKEKRDTILQQINDAKKCLNTVEKKLKLKEKNTGEITPFDYNDFSVNWLFDADGVFAEGHESHFLPGHFTTMSIGMTGSSGLTWYYSGMAGSFWYGSTPYNAYFIKNTVGMTVYGIAVSLELNNITLSGATYCTSSIENTNSNYWKAENTFDCSSGGLWTSVVWRSTSSTKLYSTSSQDTTYVQITGYVSEY